MFKKIKTFIKDHWLELAVGVPVGVALYSRAYFEARRALALPMINEAAKMLHDSAIRMEAITKNGGTIVFTNAEIIKGRNTSVSERRNKT